jgi:hypothetical protein
VIRRLAAALGAAALLAVSPVQAQDGTDQEERVRRFAELPYWPGYWVSEQYANTTIGGFSGPRPAGAPPIMRLNGFDAPWNEEGKRRQAEAAKLRPGRKAMGWGYPMMMDAATPVQFMITPEEVLIVNAYGETRQIYTDGRPLPPAEDMWPTVWGTSIGHWEGDTLVVETVQVQMPFTYFHGAPSLSEDAVYHERIRLAGGRIVTEYTITDPVTLTGPWKVTINLVREEAFDRMVQMDFSNDRTGSEDGVNTIEPPADEAAGQ